VARTDLVVVGGMDVEGDAVSLRPFVADRSSLVPAVFFPRVSMAGVVESNVLRRPKVVLFTRPKVK